MPRKATKTRISNNKASLFSGENKKAGLPLRQNKRGYSLEATSYASKIEDSLQNQSKLSLILGTLIVLVVGILIFNYFNKSKSDLGPAQQTQQESSKNSLDKYTVKEGDTLFAVADQYYKDGYKFDEIARANNLTDPDLLETGQVLEIPKIEVATNPGTQLVSADTNVSPNAPGSEWGPEISGNSYTVEEGDWLSKIAGRAYGDIFAFDKIAKANNIPDPDLIEPGQVLTIPR